jgi:hypothetical protein
MDFQFEYSASLLKAGKASEHRIPITIIPNRPTNDKQNDTIFLSAFDQECIKSFLQEGIIDYDHLSVRGKDDIVKAQAHIGDPEELFIDEKRGVPVCNAYLFKNNPFVKSHLGPALEAGSKTVGASVGGSAMKSSYKDPINKTTGGKNIYKVRLKHIACCLLQKAIHPGTLVSLRKSQSDTEIDTLVFNTIDEFCKSLGDEEYLTKALTAGAGTDVAELSGGQALQTQSLEKTIVKTALPFFLEKVAENKIKPNSYSYMEYLTGKGLSDKVSSELITLVALNSAKIAKKLTT